MARTETTKKPSTSRVRKLDYRGKKKVVRSNKPLPSGFKLLKTSIKQIWQNKRVFGGILLIYLVLFLVMVRGLALDFQLSETRQTLEEALGNSIGTLGLGVALFGTLISTSGGGVSGPASVYQTVLFVVISLAVIWALRQTTDKAKDMKIRQPFYQGMYPLIPFVLVWLVILLQLLPALIGLTLYGIVTANGIAVGVLEQVLWLLLTVVLVGVSVYLVSSSVFASYIVTLPDMAPVMALKKARYLVKFRRFLLIRKILFLVGFILLMMFLLFLPLVLYAAVLAEVVFIVFSLAIVLISHAYLYTLYKAML